MNAEKPNVVFILADDLGIGDLGCYGATKIPTPNVDALAQKGMMFWDAHAASAVCSPSRYAFVTGRYCWRSRLKRSVLGGFGQPLIEPDRMTIADMFKQAGYSTAMMGKWHLGLGWAFTEDPRPLRRNKDPRNWPDPGAIKVDFTQKIKNAPLEYGFDYFYGMAGSLDMPPYCFIENDRTVGIPSGPKKVLYNQQRQGPSCEYWKDQEVDITLVSKAREYIEEKSKNPMEPFFLYLATASPHRPCDVQPDFVKGKSEAGDRGDMCVLFDWVVGQVVAQLEESGLDKNTIIIVTSDNGAKLKCANGKDYGHKSNGDYRGQKADIWDGGHREPFIIVWKDHVPENSVSHQMICLSDMFASFADLLRVPLPDGAAPDSINIREAFTNTDLNHQLRQELVHHSSRGMFSIREGRWKLIDGLGSGGASRPHTRNRYFWRPKGQLYDMKSDHREEKNLWKAKPEIVRKLMADLQLVKKIDK